MSYPNVIHDPLTATHVTPAVTPGSVHLYYHATYGYQLLRYIQFLDAVEYTASKGHLLVLAVATGLTKGTNDRAGGSAIGTAGDAAVSQLALGVYQGSVIMPQNYWGYVVKEGVCLVKSDDGISQMHRLVADSVDGGVDTMADGEEEQVCGVALADDNDTTDLVLAAMRCI